MSSELSRYEKVFLACLSNSAIATGTAREFEIMRWFGTNASGITKEQICARQAKDAADSIIKFMGA